MDDEGVPHINNPGKDREVNELFEIYYKKMRDKGVSQDEIDKRIREIFKKSTEEAAEFLYADLVERKEDVLNERHEYENGFEERLYQTWKTPLDLLESYIIVSTEMGESFSKILRKKSTGSNVFLYEAILKLHANACKIGGEIFTLLSSGYADGANARWRSLHELVVTATIISGGGNELAERYLDHGNIESYHALLEYQGHIDHLQKFGHEKFSPQEVKEVEEAHAKLIEKYGGEYDNRYGWAAKFLNKGRPSFADLEESAGLSHLRPFYRMASHAVHANPKSVLFSLGLINQGEFLLAGPSNAGLADPGQGLAISLVQMNNILLGLEPSFTSIITMKMGEIYVKEISSEFMKSHYEVAKKWGAEKNP